MKLENNINKLPITNEVLKEYLTEILDGINYEGYMGKSLEVYDEIKNYSENLNSDLFDLVQELNENQIQEMDVKTILTNNGIDDDYFESMGGKEIETGTEEWLDILSDVTGKDFKKNLQKVNNKIERKAGPELKRKEVLFEIINDVIDGMDIYNHNGSLWLIKTEESKWAIEFTKDKSLWYNYSLFKNLFKAISLDLKENQKYVTEWFESRFLNMSKVEDCCERFFDQDQYVEDTIQNGVKETKRPLLPRNLKAKYIIENGVKETLKGYSQIRLGVKDTLQNGVRHTIVGSDQWRKIVEDTINNGVKHTEDGDWLDGDERIGDIIQNGVKETYDDCSDNIARVEGIIRVGKKII
jgi:hypothetical protein